MILILFLILIHLGDAATFRSEKQLPSGRFYRLRSDERYFGRKEIPGADSPVLISLRRNYLENVRHLAGIATRFTARYARSTLQSLVAEKRSFNFSSSAAFRSRVGILSPCINLHTVAQKLNFNLIVMSLPPHLLRGRPFVPTGCVRCSDDAHADIKTTRNAHCKATCLLASSQPTNLKVIIGLS